MDLGWPRVMVITLLILAFTEAAAVGHDASPFTRSDHFNQPLSLDIPQQQGLPKLESILNQLSQAYRSHQMFPAVYGTRTQELSQNEVRVIVEAQSAEQVETVKQMLQQSGGTVEGSYQSLVQALVPIGALEGLAQAEQVRLIRLPSVVQPTQGSVVSEGVAKIGADKWHEAGFNGKGIKIGILDLSGFKGYQALLDRELPPASRVHARGFGKPIEGFSDDDPDLVIHGTAVAEVVFDMAPGAEFFLADFNTLDVDFPQAVDWLIAQGVNVINTSWEATTGCLNGDGLVGAKVAEARSHGILWVTAAGNEGDKHWQGAWRDDGHGQLEFAPSHDIIAFRASDNAVGFTVSYFLRWEDPCKPSSNEYDLFLVDGNGKIVAASTNNTSITGPYQRISFKIPSAGDYGIVVRKTSGAKSVDLDLLSYDVPFFDLDVANGSVSYEEPSISSNAMTVGAIDLSDQLESFSSQGPTKDDRVKPDIVSYDGVANVTYGTFSGTSAAAPHVTGAAALVKQAFPNFGPDQIQNYLEEHAEDLGLPGKDDQYGAGVLILGAPPTSAPAKPTNLVAQALSSSSIQLAWTDNSSNEAAFQIERRLQGGDFKQIGSTQANVTSFTDTGLSPATTYCYRVRAVNDAGSSDYSNEACATTLAQLALPQITAIDPSQGVQSSSVKAIIKGQHLSNAQSVIFSGLGVTAVIEPGGSDTALPITITIAPDAAPGPRTFRVTTSAGTADSNSVVFTVTAQSGVGLLIALRFDKLEFLAPNDWSRAIQSGCVVYTNISNGPSTIRLTLPSGNVQEYEIPVGNQVIVCGDVAHIDTRPPKSP